MNPLPASVLAALSNNGEMVFGQIKFKLSNNLIKVGPKMGLYGTKTLFLVLIQQVAISKFTF